ncbi:DUF2911 domain-containing protein [Flavobacteriaceae bacterium S356]|uniref:DUF2911 domain-containing protein n=1 Tax=Asprobacillus argus TaxID=3076534 RepID=A0ABU3LFQ7_9FLAO|nr:DUF2911 domain-containing protein [Flavobacteriaceae bacterium S356]
MVKTYLLFIVGFLFSIPIHAQDVGAAALKSKHQKIMSTIGTTEVSIDYHSPFVNGRKIFGGIVPYDFVVDGVEYPWRAGANKRTIIAFQHDVLIEGKPLKAGSYGLVVLVSKKKWTFIFSKGKTWGAFNYKPENDIVRVEVKTEPYPHQEWLRYEFVDRTASSAKVELAWERIKAGFTITVDELSNAINDILKKEKKTPADYQSLAEYTLRKDPSKKAAAMQWIDKSLAMEVGRYNHKPYSKLLKADVLIAMGKIKEGEALKKLALQETQGFGIYYYALRKYLVDGNKEEAYGILLDNIKRNPTHWQGHLALGEYYLKVKNEKKATESFKKAYEYAPERWKNYARYLYLQNRLVRNN